MDDGLAIVRQYSVTEFQEGTVNCIFVVVEETQWKRPILPIRRQFYCLGPGLLLVSNLFSYTETLLLFGRREIQFRLQWALQNLGPRSASN
jgi:hypothetical protein